MWRCPTRPAQVSVVMVLFVMVLWSPLTPSGSSSGESEEPKYLFSKASPTALRLEVVAILPDASNASLSFAKALGRALNSVAEEEEVGEGRNISWRVKNFVIVNSTGAEESGGGGRKGGGKKYLAGATGGRNITFNPSLIPRFCDFLTRTRAVAMVNLIGDVGGERVLSLLSAATGLPLIGSSQFENPLQTLHKDKDDFYISLSTSVRQVAHALGHLLIYCHWHTFTVLFDDSPSVASTQMIWEEELSQMMATPRFYQPPSSPTNSTPTSADPDFYDYDLLGGRSSMDNGYLGGADYERNGGNDDDPETSPVLNPNFITIKNRQLNGALRALSHLTKATQGVVVLLCSERTLVQVFRAAQKLRLLSGDYVFILVGQHAEFEVIPEWVPSGVLALRSPRKAQLGKYTTKRTGKLLASALHSVKGQRLREGRREVPDRSVFNSHLHPKTRATYRSVLDLLNTLPNVSCSKASVPVTRKYVSQILTREMRSQMEEATVPAPLRASRAREMDGSSLTFDILNLVDTERVDVEGKVRREWHRVGNVSVDEVPSVELNTIQWPGGGIFGPGDRPAKTYRIVTITAPPFVMDAEADDNKTCVKGLPCLKVNTTNKDELAVIFAEHDRGNNAEASYELACCDGLAMDLLISISRELKFEIDLYLVPDGYFGSRSSNGTWNGLMSVLVSGSAHMSFAPFSVTSIRATAVDFSTPFFFSGVGFLGRSKNQDVPLMAFLAPFSFELWAAIFLTLNMTALAVALFEWLSPFGLNPWGRQRTKNFSMASALWVVWGRLFSHLVAFKAPKSWPNKFLINVWGGFSVIFVASYTANIAALFAGKFFQRGVDFHDRSLLSQRVAVVKHSATDFYIKRENQQLWEHIQTFPVHGFQQGVEMLKNQTLDLLVGDGPLLDYYRGADPTCNLIDVSNQDKIGDDTYAVAMTKGFPLKESISTLIAKYIGNGYMDYLQGKWYGQLECFRRRSELVRARALGVDSVAGMIIMLGVGTLVGLLILTLELIVYKYALPYFRRQPKGTIWRSPNIMFFSQKLYRFINCVELVSPHHAAKELVNTLRHGQITSLFQKSVKRKEHEQRRRRKSKAQFFEMIQEVRRVQKHERQQSVQRQESSESETRLSTPPIYSIHARLESNKQTPKLVRVLGSDVDLSLQQPRHSITSPILEVAEEAMGSHEGLYRRRTSQPLPSTSAKRKRLRKILKAPDPSQPSSSAILRHKAVEFDLEDEEGEEEEEDPPRSPSEDEEGLGPSALNTANLRHLSKRQVISLWRTSELDLRRQLALLTRERNELKLRLHKAASAERPP